MKRRALALWFACCCLATLAWPAAEPGPTTVFLVRHAEKTDGRDPALSAPGVERARELARITADAGIAAIYSTQFTRTRQTAQAVAERLGLSVIEVAVGGDSIETHARELADRILEEHAGQRVLVVGHSNTVPEVIQALGVSPEPRLTEKDYDDLFVVTVYDSARAGLIHLHYGPAYP